MYASLVCVALMGFVLVSGQTTTPEPCDPNVNNGFVEIGCWGFKKCVNGIIQTINCQDGYVYERDLGRCVLIKDAQNDCNLPIDCSTQPDGSYADKGDHCITYYRCYDGRFFGHFYCPTGTRFDEATGLCNYESSVIC